MNLAATGLGVALAAAVLAALAALLLPARHRVVAAGAGSAFAGFGGVLAGGAALTGQTFSVALPGMLPLSGVALALDPLGGLFVAVTGLVAVPAAVYGIGYTRHALAGRTVQAGFPLFVASLLLVPAAANVGTFLACWELMALTSLLLVLAEHRRRPQVADAGRWYAVLTHLGLVAILAGLMLFAAHAGGDSFAALRSAGDGLPPAVAATIFLATLAGFASKAGIVPLHVWLPRAHPEAPSHVSAVMSAAMVALGCYGIVRVGADLLGGGPLWWWALLLGLGVLSAVHGILQAAMSTDLKRLLGHSTTENMGLVLIGLGAAGMFAASGDRALAALAMAAALLHVVNHGVFKTLLFLAAGSVLHATGTRDLDRLGGLRAGLPATTVAFGVGALAASALPPGTAFVSEWLLLQSLIHGWPSTGYATAVVLPVAVAAIALTAGLAVATFVKAFGVGFLARPRSERAAGAVEGPPSMRAGMALAAAGCAVLALVPAVVLPALAPAVALGTGAEAPVARGAVTVELTGVAGSLSPLVLAVGLALGVLVVAGAVHLLTRWPAWRTARRPARRAARLWDCGAGPLSARMEYTATSFAEPLQRVFDDVLQPDLQVDVIRHRESAYLVRAVRYRRTLADRIERRIYGPVLGGLRAWGRAATVLANGSVHRYLGYGFGTVIGLLLVLTVTR